MRKLRVHVLYEHGTDLRSYCSGQIRLLRPLRHPRNAERIELTSGRTYDGQPCDAVIVERLWRPDMNLDKAGQLVEAVRTAGARLIYSQDDNIYDLREAMPGSAWLRAEHLAIMRFLQHEATGTLVSTDKLRERLAPYGSKIVVVPNQLDERLFVGPAPGLREPKPGRLRVGYMGTPNHDADMAMIAPALAALMEVHPETELEIVGGITRALPFGLEPRRLEVPASARDYPLFLMWFLSTVRWDIALAPLCDSAYARCKSDMKWLDYGALGTAGVFSRVEPYRSIRSGENGLVVDNDAGSWTDALLHLADDAVHRRRIAMTTWNEVRETRTLQQRARDWADALEELLS